MRQGLELTTPSWRHRRSSPIEVLCTVTTWDQGGIFHHAFEETKKNMPLSFDLFLVDIFMDHLFLYLLL